MRAVLICAAVACLVSAAAGCAGGGAGSSPKASASALTRVELGMTASEVETAVGVPLEKDAEGGDVEVWYYRGGVVILEGSRVTACYPTAPSGS